jgi:threonine dehydrogenase-like Zn-dependent dehydrogenase
VVLGSYPSPISLPGIGREASVVFSSVYRDDREFAAALRLLARGLIDVAPLTTSAMPLTSYGEAFASLRDPERAVKVFLDPAAVPGAEVPV